MRRPSLYIFLLVGLSIVMSCSSSEPARWNLETSSDGSKPIARHEAAFVGVNGKFFLLGGRRVQPVSIYNPVSKKWTEGTPPPLEIHHFQPLVWEGEIWIGGAFTGGYPNETPIPYFIIYNPDKDEWRKGPDIPESRLRGATGMVLHDAKMYMFCGLTDGHRGKHRRWADEFNPKTGEWRQLPDAPRARDHFQASMVEGKAYMLAGRRTQSDINPFAHTERAVDVFDFDSESWITLTAKLPTPRAGTFNHVHGEDIWVIGGESDTQEVAHHEIEALDTKSKVFEVLPPLPEGRHGTGVICWEKGLYISSGCGNRGGNPELTSQWYFPIKD
ncbi:MAG: galactose oxidase [Bacteroidota bacterium]